MTVCGEELAGTGELETTGITTGELETGALETTLELGSGR